MKTTIRTHLTCQNQGQIFEEKDQWNSTVTYFLLHI